MAFGYQILRESFLLPSPYGAYIAAKQREKSRHATLLLSLMDETVSFRLTNETLFRLAGVNGPEDTLDLLWELQQSHMVQADVGPRCLPPQKIERVLPSLLSKLCDSQIALLSDEHGLCLAHSGLGADDADEVCALSVELTRLSHRYGSLLSPLENHSAGWGLVNERGAGKLNFWPIYLGRHQFSLIAFGMPRLNQAEFLELIWLLQNRYGKPERA